MTTELTVEKWIAIRKEEGLKIDPTTAEVDGGWRRILDPYEVLRDLPPECDCAGRVFFARRPGSKIWVEFNDLPDDTCAVLWERLKSGLTKFDDEVPWA